MPKRSHSLIASRDKAIKDSFNRKKEKFPQWRYDALLADVAKEFFLEPGTIQKIILGDKPAPTNQLTIFDQNPNG